jgi:hypothetical protein
MAEAEGVRASDDDRDVAAGVLADAVAVGRLSLAEHSSRLDALYAAVTQDQVSAVTADVPARPARRGAFFRAFDPYRGVVIGGHARRAGRFRIGRFCTLVTAFGDLELDLRAAQLSQDEISLTVYSLAARVTVTVPANWRVLDEVLVVGRRRAVNDDDAATVPLLRLRGTVFAGSFRLSRG